MNLEEMTAAGFRPVDWLQLDKVQPAKAVIPGLLNEGEFGSLVGQAACGKSLLMLDIAVSIALGKPVLGEPSSDPAAVMYVDLENPAPELAERLRQMGHAPADLHSSPLHYISFPDMAPLDSPEGGRKLAKVATLCQPKLIVLDTISRMVQGKEDSADTWRDLYNHTMIPLRQQGCTVLRLDHQGHDSTKGARGSSAKRDDVDVAWIIKTTGNDVTLTCNKGRGLAHPEKIPLRRHTSPTRHLPVVGDKVAQCVAALESLGVAWDTTRDEAADVLRANEFKFGNGVIGQAVKARRSSPSQRTEQPPDK